MKKQSVVLRWKRQSYERGLASVGQGPRGWNLCWKCDVLGYVRPKYAGFGRHIVGWFFVARHDTRGVPLENTASTPATDSAQARQQAAEYVLKHLRVAHPDCDFKIYARIPGVEEAVQLEAKRSS